jgi:flagellar hook-length control protein FliK
MSRVNQSTQSNPISQQAQTKQPKTQQKAGETSVFAKKMNNGDKKTDQTKKQPQSPSSSQAQKKEAGKSGLLSRGPMVYGRKGKGNTVADLQARLDQATGQTKSKGLKTALDADMPAQTNANQGQSSLGVSDKPMGKQGQPQLDQDLQQMQTDLTTSNQAVGQPGPQMNAQGNNIPTGVVEVTGPKIPTQMLDKIVDQARVGVNAKGAPEFQFELKGDVLGGLKMRMNMEGGKLNAVFIAENSDIRRFIDGNLQDLRRSLEDRGIFIRDLEVRDPKEDQRQRQRDQNQKDRQDAMDQ